MKAHRFEYKDDGKAELRMTFGDGLVLVVSAPVSVTLEGEQLDELTENEVENMRDGLQKFFTHEMDKYLVIKGFEVAESMKRMRD